MTDPRHPDDFSDPNDPDSLPVLTDVLVAGRPPMPRPAAGHDAQAYESHETRGTHEVHEAPAAVAEPPSGQAAAKPLSEASAAGEPAAVSRAEPAAEPAPPPAAPASPAELPAATDPAELSERDAEHLAERLRVRFAGYLREEGRGVIEARCRDALQEHTSWLVRQVTREVALALEGEVVGWVRDAVREELAAHRASRRTNA